MLAKPEVIAALSALAHPVRLDVFKALVEAGMEGATPTHLAAVLRPEPKQSTLATHLKELVAARLVVSARDGRSAVYRADYAQMSGVLGFLTMNCCRGLPAASTEEVGSSSCSR